MTHTRPTPRMTDRQRRLGSIVCMATMLLAILDMNIVSAATVPIVRDLDPVHGIDSVAWLVTGFALASTAALPLYGKLCDVLGAKPVFLSAVGVFLFGSILCGFAGSLGQLIAFRAVQGIGGGGLMSVTLVVLAQMHTDTSGQGRSAGRGGLMGGLGMAVGPILGGLLADAGNWRWIFYINIPLGIAILVIGSMVFRLPSGTRRGRLDVAGAGLAAVFATALSLLAEWGGTEFGWGSPVVLGLAGTTIIAFGLFIWRQRTAAEPILPLSLFRIRTIRLGYVIQTLFGVAMMGVIIYVMLYLQVVKDVAATDASLFMLPFAAGMAASGLVASTLTGRGVPLRTFMVSGTGFGAVALAALSLSTMNTPLWITAAEMCCFGIGAGQVLGMLVMAVIRVAPPDRIGVATTGIRFFQSLGGAVGAAVLGTILHRGFAADAPGIDTGQIAGLDGTERVAALTAFSSAIDVVFAIGAAVLVLAALSALRLPRPEAAEPDPAPEPVAAG